MSRLAIGLGAGLAISAAWLRPHPLEAQGYRLRLEARYQSVSVRGVELDSIPIAQAVIRPGQGPTTPEGIAADCGVGTGFCYFFRPGNRRNGHPLATTADLTLWGLGLKGLTAHASGRLATDLATGVAWPATAPNVVLTESYAEYAGPRLLGRLGRQVITGRLGYQGFDGARATLRVASLGLQASAYGGWGLARAVAIPVTSPALNPLDDFQPRDRQLVVGAEIGVRHRVVDLAAEYRREVDPTPDYLVSERAAATASLRPAPRIRISGGAEYDFANGWWGSAEVGASYVTARLNLSAEARRYRPFFDLWTIWGAFSPVPYRSIRGSAAIEPVKGLWIRGLGERYWFDEAAAETPLATAEDRGWRAVGTAIFPVDRRWTVEAGLRAEFGPGSSSRTVDGAVSYAPTEALFLSARIGALDRPLEFRFTDARLNWASLTGDLKISDQFRLVADLGWFEDRRRRPDAAGFDLSQLRASTRLVVSIGSSADRLPPAVRRPAAERPR